MFSLSFNVARTMSWLLPMVALGKCSGVCLVDTGFKTSWDEYVVNLIVYVSIRRVPRCSAW